MRRIAISNQKGGSCKTTTAVSLAAGLGKHGRRVLLIDMDPQAHTTYWLKVADVEKGVYGVLANNEDIVDNVHLTNMVGVELMPSSDWLYGIGKALANEIGPETILDRKINGLPPTKWDYVIIDCPPDLGLLTVNALAAAREVIIPVEASALALSGVAKLTNTIGMIQERINPEIDISGVLVCKMESTILGFDVVRHLEEAFGDKVFERVIPKNVRIAECPSTAEGLSIFDYAPDSLSGQAYMEVVQAIMEQEGSEIETRKARTAKQPV